MRWLTMVGASLAAMLLFSCLPASAQSRIALVVANSAYQGAPPLATTPADAGLIVETLKAAGYDVVEASDVTKVSIGQAVRTLLDKAAAAGPNAVVFVYFAGHGAQLNAENFLVPVDAQINSADAVESEALSVSAVINALAALPAAARIVVLDAARDHGFGRAAGQAMAPGLALIGAPPGTLVAYSASSGAAALDGPGPYSPYAVALTTLMRQPCLDIEQIFTGVRLQVNQATSGSQIPYMVSALNVEVRLFPGACVAAAPEPGVAPAPGVAAAPAQPQILAPALGVTGIAVPPRTPRRVTKPAMARMSADEAYRVAIEKDSLEPYQWFVEHHPRHSFAGQIWDIIDKRRQDILWRRARTIGSPQAYWNYIKRYPNGAHDWEARRWLGAHGLPLPPPNYVPVFQALPSGYYDEAVGLVELVPAGTPRHFRVFDPRAPLFVPAPPPRRPAPVQTVNVQPPPPAPVQQSNLTAPVVVPRTDPQPLPQPQPVYREKTQKELEAILKDLDKTPPASLPTGPRKPGDPLNAEEVRQQVLQQLEAQKKLEQAAKPPALGPDQKPILIPRDPKETNRWQQLVQDKEKREKERQNPPQLSAADASKPVRQGPPIIVD